MKILTFRAGQSLLGVPVDDVQEIIDSWSFTPLPLLPSAFRGVTSVRGEAVPVADVTRLVAGTSGTPRRAMVVLRASIALLVDTIEDIVELDRIDPPANGPPWISGLSGEVRIMDGGGLRG